MTKPAPLSPPTTDTTDPLAFTPVPRQRMRRGGWSPARQREFIALLAETGSVRAACRRMGVGEHHIYKLRAHPEAASFRRAWEAALDCGIARIEDTAMDRALYGVETPIYWQGEQVGQRTVYNDRLLMFILRNRAPDRFAEGQNGRRRLSGMGGLNAVSQMQLDRLKKQWRKEWENERAKVSTADVRASIDRKIIAIRSQMEAEQAAAWAKLSDETRAAWARFAELRERDLAAANATETARSLVNVKPDAKDWPPAAPPAPKVLPPPEPPRTAWTMKDEGFDP